MAGQDVKFTTRNNESYDGYVSAPAGEGKSPAILLITAIFGADEEMRKLSDDYARDGFLVYTPDVFWRTMPGPTHDFGKAIARYESFDQAQGLRDMEDLMKAIRSDPRCNGKVAALGFCFGGLYAYLAAARLGANAAGAYHGTKIGDHLDEVGKVAVPVSFHYGKEDPIVPLAEVDAVQKAFAGRANATVALHEGATHNFSMPTKDGYHPAVAAASREAVLSAFRSM